MKNQNLLKAKILTNKKLNNNNNNKRMKIIGKSLSLIKNYKNLYKILIYFIPIKLLIIYRKCLCIPARQYKALLGNFFQIPP